MEILGQKVDMQFTYQVQLNGEVYQQQVFTDPAGQQADTARTVSPLSDVVASRHGVSSVSAK
jgi:hypothetical protein